MDGPVTDTGKKPKKDIVIPPKKPKLSKAERRALQEEQRAAKGLKADGSSSAVGGSSSSANDAGSKKKPKQKGGGGGGGSSSTAATGGGASSVAASHSSRDHRGSMSGSVANAQVSNIMSTSANDTVDGAGLNTTLTFFSHLPPFKDYKKIRDFNGIQITSTSSSSSSSSSSTVSTSSATTTSSSTTTTVALHPAVLSLGLEYADGSIRGANSRCIAMLETFQKVIRDYTFCSSTNINTATSTDYRHDLEHRVLKPAFTYWTTQCRIHSVTMGNAFTFLKLAVANLDRDLEIEQAKRTLCEGIDAYIQERMKFASVAICKFASSKIVEGDVILTYAKNDLIEMLLAKQKKKFRVILVDSRPLLEGKEMLEKLMDAGIECSYILLNSLSYVMKEVTKVFLGASALMSDGSILSRIGSASVAMMAKSHNVPVLVCCETYKISNRVQLESITWNELGNPEDVLPPTMTMRKKWKEEGSEEKKQDQSMDCKHLRLLNLLYDLTPSEFVSGIVTEMGILPPTSVAVLLREMNPQDNAFKAGEDL
mmetsp:Transcript_841/g.1453  ORF Transcript_841/g.1453 Transcript_841/m.1453 type:complete len:539 (-) Transcript_841:8-1624(-)